jgi:hypothetical protein
VFDYASHGRANGQVVINDQDSDCVRLRRLGQHTWLGVDHQGGNEA